MKQLTIRLFFIFTVCSASLLSAQNGEKYKIHDKERPQPEAVTHSTFSRMANPPSDAVVLFDGTDLSEWVSSSNGKKARWPLGKNFFEVKKKTGGIRTVREFGDLQLHIEWSAPNKIEGEGQGRGNSGVFFIGKSDVSYGYEVQVLDSYQNQTYPDGQASAIYGQYPPYYNATAPPGEWQTYDIIFIRPRFDKSGKLLSPAYITVIHNGVVVHHNRELLGPTTHKVRTDYSFHPDRLPIALQDHGNPVRYRNIWVRDLERE